jgi:RNA polymerase sigma-70 factor (ECF subfamily)
LAAARKAHPSLSGVTDELYIRHLGSCVSSLEALTQLHADDVLLALGCAQGEPQALSELDRRIAEVVPRAVSRLSSASSFPEEVRQLLAQRLLVAPAESQVRILDYRGKGPMDRWLRAAAVRVGLNLLESDKSPRQQGESALRGLPDGAPTPERDHLRRRYGPEFKAAVESALAGLSPKERNYLRLHFVEGLTLEQIGAMEGAHKSSVSRWLSRARQTVGVQVRDLLGQRLKLSAEELDSLMGLLQSELELSLMRVL